MMVTDNAPTSYKCVYISVNKLHLLSLSLSLQAGMTRVKIPVGDFPLLQKTLLALDLSQPSIQWLPGFIPGCKAAMA